jgi:leucyl-tRNA---protein transferase
MSEHPKFPEFFVTNPTPCPYLPDKEERKLFTHITHERAKATIDQMLTNGFRRSQNVAYTPYCLDCCACVSVRVVAADFAPGRTMRRVAQRNQDLSVRRCAALPTAEHHGLFRRYIASRHEGGGMSDMTVLDFAQMIEDTIVDTTLVEYRLPPTGGADTRGQLVGVALQDKLSDGLSLVYSFFDPDYPERSLGTYMIMEAIQSLAPLGLTYAYLGYWVQRSAKMNYKARFQPLEMLTGDGWVRQPVE